MDMTASAAPVDAGSADDIALPDTNTPLLNGQHQQRRNVSFDLDPNLGEVASPGFADVGDDTRPIAASEPTCVGIGDQTAPAAGPLDALSVQQSGEDRANLRGHGHSYARSVVPSADREKDDFYPTPAPAVRSLLALERFEGPIWECACGDGAISRELEAAGHEVISTDLCDRGYGLPRVDFLLERKLLAPTIITNPPFKNAEAFVRHALDLGATKVVMMLRLAWLEGSQRKALFEETPLARVIVASRRLRMQRGGGEVGGAGGSMIAFAWFIWDRSHVGAPNLAWFDWKAAA